MIGMRMCWLAVEALLLGLFFYTGRALPLAAALALLLAVLGAIPCSLLVRKKLRAELELPVNLPKGKSGEGTITVENPTLFPVFCLTCRVRVENILNGDGETQSFRSFLLPRSTGHIPLTLGSDYCGRLRVTAEKIILSDCFGVIGIACPVTVKKSVTVHPDTFEQTIRMNYNLSSSMDSDQYSPYCPGPDLAETFQIREYAEGDSPRQIHWKLSGKFDRLIVRDPSLPVTRSVLVFWERTGQSGDRDRTDAQAEAVASVCRTLLQQDVAFTLGWNEEQGCILQNVADFDEFVGILPRMLGAAGRAEGVSGVRLLLQTGRFWSQSIFVGEDFTEEGLPGHVTWLTCGKQAPKDAVSFDAENYETQLAQLEI